MNILTEQVVLPMTFSEWLGTSLNILLEFNMRENILSSVYVYVALIYSLLFALFFDYTVLFSDLHEFRDNKFGLKYIAILNGPELIVSATQALRKR